LDHLRTITNLLKGGEVAGMVLSSAHGFDEVVIPLIEEEYPIVLLDTAPEGACVVTLNHVMGVSSAGKHLASLGKFPIACITFAPWNPHVDMRLRAFYDGLQSCGVSFDERYLRYGAYDPDSGYAEMKSLLQEDPYPRAVFGMNDMMALGAVRAILDAGLRIPEDIAVVGYDDMRFAEFTNPALTTVRAPEIELGRVAGQRLIDFIEGKVIKQKETLLDTELIVRASCGAR
ncbi:MAG: substrate-binding domain-containing protein, partial [Anaerolineae bacterium]|nr:substrate-binding domain-containing protein [Anaerolineae bacterium]